MSGDILHRIFYQFDGEACARMIKDFFSGRKYNVQFNLHELQNANVTYVSNVGLSILLLTTQSLDFIRSQKHLDLNAIFPNPELSVVLFFRMENTTTEIRMLLSSRIRNFQKWTIMEYLAGSSLNALDKDIMKLVEKSEGCTPVPSLQKVRAWTSEGLKSHEEVLLMFTKPIDPDSEVMVIRDWDDLKQTAERLNSMTYSFNVGDVEPGERKIEVFVKKTSFGRIVLHVPCVEATMEEISKLLHNVINPVKILCQCLHIVPASREDLDRKLLNLLSNNTSSVSQIFQDLDWGRFGDFDSNYELPTLLHFGAKYGLRLFCMEILSLPGGRHALKMKNKDGMLPYQMAEKEGFDHLALELDTDKKVSCTSSIRSSSDSGLGGEMIPVTDTRGNERRQLNIYSTTGQNSPHATSRTTESTRL
ncbi:hypothetical protein CHS0354_033118 [Potamilus streckersoni]|uniref:DBB domain-containing protein n=1 Tax=Potamilus streckersoni TaxID=2493646 RepID=A0AAE0S6X0_9BIVA|nr:hypothetical protein CHS0354_033118 [Potamilus streckersoni]